jgi:hypothetical protein
MSVDANDWEVVNNDVISQLPLYKPQGLSAGDQQALANSVLPASAALSLQPGMLTVFKNGQVWAPIGGGRLPPPYALQYRIK